MQKYGFSLTHILPYKNRSADSVLIRENTVSENLYSRIISYISHHYSVSSSILSSKTNLRYSKNVKKNKCLFDYPIKCLCCPHIETSHLICFVNQLTGFYMRAALAFIGLIIMKVRVQMKTRSHRYDINRTRPRHGYKYTKHKM